jgi:hypothetical protein
LNKELNRGPRQDENSVSKNKISVKEHLARAHKRIFRIFRKENGPMLAIGLGELSRDNARSLMTIARLARITFEADRLPLLIRIRQLKAWENTGE